MLFPPGAVFMSLMSRPSNIMVWEEGWFHRVELDLRVSQEEGVWVRGSESVLHSILIEEAGEGRAADSHGSVLGDFSFLASLAFLLSLRIFQHDLTPSASQPEVETGMRRVYMSRQC